MLPATPTALQPAIGGALCGRTSLAGMIAAVTSPAGETALYPGSFDPFHLGHLAVVHLAAAEFTKLVVAVVANPAKTAFLSAEERVDLVREAVEPLPNVEVTQHYGLLVDLANVLGANVVVRAAGKEQGDELVMAAMNQRMTGLKTVFVAPTTETSFIGSRHIRELVHAGEARLTETMVPGNVFQALLAIPR